MGGDKQARRMAAASPLFSWFDCGQRGVLVIQKVNIMNVDAPRACIKAHWRGSDEGRGGGIERSIFPVSVLNPSLG